MSCYAAGSNQQASSSNTAHTFVFRCVREDTNARLEKIKRMGAWPALEDDLRLCAESLQRNVEKEMPIWRRFQMNLIKKVPSNEVFVCIIEMIHMLK
jgi:hypothetical protein